MMCSRCRRVLPASRDFFMVRNGKVRGTCRTCKRRCDLRRFYRLKILHHTERVEQLTAKLADVEALLG